MSNLNKKLLESFDKLDKYVLIEDEEQVIFTPKDVKDIDVSWSNYRIGKNGIRFTANINFDNGVYHDSFVPLTIIINAHGEPSCKWKKESELAYNATSKEHVRYNSSTIQDVDTLMKMALDKAVEKGYIEEVGNGIYKDKIETEKAMAKQEILDIAKQPDSLVPNEAKIDKLLKDQPKRAEGPNRYLYALCAYLGWHAPMFIDPGAGGVRLKYREGFTNDELREIVKAANELGVRVIIRPIGGRDNSVTVQRYEGK